MVHCLIQRRPDGRGSNTNARLFAAGKSFAADLTPGSAGGLGAAGFRPDARVISCSPARTASGR